MGRRKPGWPQGEDRPGRYLFLRRSQRPPTTAAPMAITTPAPRSRTMPAMVAVRAREDPPPLSSAGSVGPAGAEVARPTVGIGEDWAMSCPPDVGSGVALGVTGAAVSVVAAGSVVPAVVAGVSPGWGVPGVGVDVEDDPEPDVACAVPAEAAFVLVGEAVLPAPVVAVGEGVRVGVLVAAEVGLGVRVGALVGVGVLVGPGVEVIPGCGVAVGG